MLEHRVRAGYRVLLAGSYQYLRFGSVAYQAVESTRTIPAATLAALPREIRLESWLKENHCSPGPASLDLMGFRPWK